MLLASLPLAMGLLLLFCPASKALLTISSLLYGIFMSELNIADLECGVGRFREPNTAFTMAMTDGFSEYIYIAFPTDTMAKIVADLSHSLFSIWTSYTDRAQQIEEDGSLLDSEIVLDGDNPNPFVNGNAIDSESRSYTIYAGKDRPDYATNWLSTQTYRKERISILILRVVGEYGDEQGLSSGEWIPKVTIYDEEGNQEKCAFLRDQGRFPILKDTYLTPVATPDACNLQVLFEADVFPEFSFYPMPRTSHAFANKADGSYLAAEIDYDPSNPDMYSAFVVEFKNPPRVFSPGDMHPMDSLFDENSFDTRYTSLCFYMNFVAAPRGINCVTGMDLYNMYLEHGVSYVIGGDASLRQHFEGKGIPFLEFNGGSDIGTEEFGRYPFFIYRSQFPSNPAYDVDKNVPRWDERCFGDKVTNGYYKADNEDYLGERAPIGRQCSRASLLINGCGFEGLDKLLNRGPRDKLPVSPRQPDQQGPQN